MLRIIFTLKESTNFFGLYIRIIIIYVHAVIYPFNTPMKTLNFLFLCLIFTTNASSIAKTPIGSAKKFVYLVIGPSISII